MSNNISRLYNVKDDKLTILAGVTLDHYVKHQEKFTAFNAVVFPADFHEVVLKVKLSAAQNTLSDAFVVKSQAKETADVQEAKKKLLKPMRELAFVVETCFAHEPLILNAFMLDLLHSKAQNIDGLIGYTKDVLNMVEKHKTALLAQGMKESLPTDIEEAQKNLDMQRREQIEVIKSRPAITQERIEKMNDLWRELVKINKAASVIFDEHPETLALFELPRPIRNGSDEASDELDEEIIVAQ